MITMMDKVWSKRDNVVSLMDPKKKQFTRLTNFHLYDHGPMSRKLPDVTWFIIVNKQLCVINCQDNQCGRRTIGDRSKKEKRRIIGVDLFSKNTMA